ncbi:hypothetical protein [Hyphomicrobium sp. 99]|uniref:hypothetical protein n=1 Tax=Hyphomicrobium sp. 99 TaxID=1163419 RepID=UPI0005F7C364|nr:hypothetical protein [Hyphomicrobium sp. 99]
MKTFSNLALRIGRALVISAASVLPSSAATSDDLFNNYFANVLDGAPCFARTYDEPFLQGHPDQRVRKIEIDLAKQNSDGTPNSADRFEIGFGLMLKSGPDWYGQAASCKTNDADFECFLEGDGGVFRLMPRDGGGLRLETGDSGIAIQGGAGDVELSGKNGDDRTFELVQSKEECRSAEAFFDSSTND